ncbi:hypothetical protein JCM11641_007530 [Rhodosporidiobolus odoratus]
MASPLLTSPVAPWVVPHLCPILESFSDPSLVTLLERTQIPSLGALLQPYQHSVTRIQTRSHTYQPQTLPAFPFQIHERPLPPTYGTPQGSTPSIRPTSGSFLTSAHGTPATPVSHPSQAERDDLFLDSLGASLSDNLTTLLNSPNLPLQLKVKPRTLRPRLPEQGQPIPERNEENEGWEDKTVEDLAPWFAQMQKQVLARREMVEWETFGWPVACLLGLSTSSPDPLNALSALWELTSPSSLFSPSSYPPRSGAEEDSRHDWANPDVLRCVVLVHDWGAGGGREGWQDAQQLHETIRKTYGLHTALLPIFSGSSTAKLPQPPSETAVSLYSFLCPSSPTTAAHTPNVVVGLGYDVPDEPIPTSAAEAITGVEAEGAGESPPGHELSDQDLTAIAKFVREMVVQSVVPWMERQVVVGNEQFTASRRSLGGRLFSAGRKYFGGGSGSGSNAPSRAGSPGPGGIANVGYNVSKGYYPQASQESQTRRLADLAFMLGDYKLAAQVYEQASKDFRGDKAWRYYSAACRMAGLSQLLLHPPSVPLPPPTSPSSPDAWLALAALVPVSPAASSTFDSLRSTLLYYLVYRSLPPPPSPTPSSGGTWDLSIPALLRCAESLGEEVVAAVLLEQAALADLRVEKRWIGDEGGRRRRKFGLHMGMAAVRYEKCGVKSLSLRCLSQASSLYSLSPPPPPSSSVEEPPSVTSTSLSDPRLPSPSPSSLSTFLSLHHYLHHSLGRQSYTIGHASEACHHFLQLLAGVPPGGGGGSGESETDHGVGAAAAAAGGGVGGGVGGGEWLDDFALAWMQLGLEARVRKGEGEGGNKWELPIKLVEARRAKVRVGSAAVAGMEVGRGEGIVEGWEGLEKEVVEGWKKGEGKGPKRVVWTGGERGEAVVGELFHLVLPVSNPLEAFLSLGDIQVDTSAGEGELEIESPVGGVDLAPGEKSQILIPIRARTLGTYTFHSLSYLFASLLPVTEQLSSPSVRFSKPSHPVPGKPSIRSPDPLTVTIKQPVPVLSVEVGGLPERMVQGEMRTVEIGVENVGGVAMSELHAICSQPSFALISPAFTSPATLSREDGTTAVPDCLRSNSPVPLLPQGKVLQPGERVEVEVLCRGDQVGEVELKWLFAFKGVEDDSNECYSTRAVHRLQVLPSLNIRYGVRPNTKEGNPFILDVEALNAGLPAPDVRITSLSLISPRWSLSLAPGLSFEQEIASPLGWQQGSRFFLALDAVPREETERDEAVEFTVKKVEGLLQGREVGKDRPGEIGLNTSSVTSTSSTSAELLPPDLLPSLLASYNCSRLSDLAASFPTLPRALLPSIFPLFRSLSSALLLVSYSSPSLSTSGQLLLPLSIPTPTLDAPLRAVLDAAERSAGGGLYEESQRERAALLIALRRSELGGGEELAGRQVLPAVVSVEVAGTVQHDFATSPCVRPIRFDIRNLSPTTPLAYTLTLGANESPRGAILVGALTHTGTLPPLALTTISSQLWLPRPGVFRAGDWRLAVRPAEAEVEASPINHVYSEGPGREIRIRDVGQQRPVVRAEVAETGAATLAVDVQA